VESQTRDGHRLRLYANAERPTDIARARAMGVEGLGLYRTEFMFLARDGLPDEDEQFASYRDVVVGMGGLPVTIRTLDLGADKADSSGLVLDDEPNPALGVRGIRLSLAHPDLLVTQLRAIVRASGYGPVRILVPMVSGLEEITQVRGVLQTCARDLRSAGHEIAEHIELGAMIEVPAAAIALPGMIRELDFVAVGTNDLVQYTLAVDRNNDALGHLYDPLHPAVLRLIARTITVAKRAGKHVSLCGEIAGDTRFAALLLALGLTEFSMHPGALLELRAKIKSLDRSKLRRHAPGLLRAATRADLEHALAQLEPEASSQAWNGELGDAPE
jgi:phosphotransferase system enzyme I (PtsI)